METKDVISLIQGHKVKPSKYDNLPLNIKVAKKLYDINEMILVEGHIDVETDNIVDYIQRCINLLKDIQK